MRVEPGLLMRGVTHQAHLLLVLEARQEDGEATVLALTDSTAWAAGATMRVSVDVLTDWFVGWSP